MYAHVIRIEHLFNYININFSYENKKTIAKYRSAVIEIGVKISKRLGCARNVYNHVWFVTVSCSELSLCSCSDSPFWCPFSPKAVGFGMFSLKLPGILFERDYLRLTTGNHPASLQEDRKAVYLTS